MLRYFAIINYIDNDFYYYNDEIEMGFALDQMLDGYYRYELPLEVKKYNYGKIIVIKMKGRGE